MPAKSLGRLGKYDLIALIGSGSFAEVYRAVDSGLKREIALKVLSPQLTGAPELRAELAREAQILAQLDHPHIVRVYEVGQDQTRHFIAMQLIGGGSLASVLEAGKAWSAERIVPLAKGIGEALDYAHGRGVLHLDVKPANILLGEGGNAYLSDFGLGRVMREASVATGVPGGSPQCMAPEQVDVTEGRERQFTAAVDLYGFGVVLYRLCTGRMPFEGEPMAVMSAHLNQQPPRPSMLRDDLGGAVDDVLLRALSKSPGARHPDAGTLAAALAEALARPADVDDVSPPREVEPLVIGGCAVRTLRDLVAASDGAWDEAVAQLYDGGIEVWLRRLRAKAAAAEAARIAVERGKLSERQQHIGLELLLGWLGYAAEPVLSVKPEVVDFGAQEKGYGWCLPATLTVRNAGRGLIWGSVRSLVPWIAVEGDGEFMVRPGDREEFAMECDIDRLPSGANAVAAAIAVRTQVGEHRVGARVTVWGPQVRIDPAEVDFGEVRDENVERVLTVTNIGRGALDVSLAEAPLRAGVRSDPARGRCTAGRAVRFRLRPNLFDWPRVSAAEKILRVETSEGEHEVAVRLTNQSGLSAPKGVLVPEMAFVPAGEFTMGAASGDGEAHANEKPAHAVSLDGYYIGRYPVTNEEYACFVRATKGAPPGHWSGGAVPAGQERHPVVNVSWADATAYCRWLSDVTGATFRLPTEAEWEKAARGMDGWKYPWGNEAPDRGRCNFGKDEGGTTPVGKYSPGGDSPYGCADMAGNVWEWVGDWYGAKYYAGSPTQNPTGPVSGQHRVLRGGSWGNVTGFVRSSFRVISAPDARSDSFGFRCARPS